jgi:high-affinity iron transporter
LYKLIWTAVAVLLGFVAQIISPEDASNPVSPQERYLHTAATDPAPNSPTPTHPNTSTSELLPAPIDGAASLGMYSRRPSYGTESTITSYAQIRSRHAEDSALAGKATTNRDTVIRRMKMQIWAGAITGGLVAMLVGAVFLFVVSNDLRVLARDHTESTLVLQVHHRSLG